MAQPPTIASISHIDVDEKVVARIVGHCTKVIQLVMDKMAHDWTAEEIQSKYPHLTLAQIHAGFAYYYDHQAELDYQIQHDVDDAQRLRDLAGESPVAKKLRSMGKLP